MFAIIAIFFDFLSRPTWTLAAFFFLSSLIKVLLKKEAPPSKPAAVAIKPSQPMKQQGLITRSQDVERDSQTEILLAFTRKMDQSFIDIFTRLQRIEENGLSIDKGAQDSLIERLKISMTEEMMQYCSKNQEQMDKNMNLMYTALGHEMKTVENSIEILLNTMIEHNKTQNEIQASIELMKQKSEELVTIDMIREVIKETIQENNHSYQIQHIQNHQIKNYLYKALDEANHEVCIISPWISKWVTEPEMLSRFKSLLARGVNLAILYGIEGNSSSMKHDQRGETTEKYVQRLKTSLTNKRHSCKLQVGKINSHYKLFICDEVFYVESSMNMLSNKEDYGQGFQWHEGGTYSEHKEMLLTLKKLYFGSNNKYTAV
ncbi:hypothetical protein [Neobacillus drentensis]|nr:hypothetical protein [Neobacillus drentensis]